MLTDGVSVVEDTVKSRLSTRDAPNQLVSNRVTWYFADSSTVEGITIGLEVEFPSIWRMLRTAAIDTALAFSRVRERATRWKGDRE